MQADDIGLEGLVRGDVRVYENAAVGYGVVAGLGRAQQQFARAGKNVGRERGALEVEGLRALVRGQGDGGGCGGLIEDGGDAGAGQAVGSPVGGFGPVAVGGAGEAGFLVVAHVVP